MVRPLIALVIVAVLGVGARAENADTNYRFHVVSDRLMKRVSRGARRNERGVVAFPQASGFVVGADRAQPKRILILTNHHVAGNGLPDGDIQFRDGTRAIGKRVLVANPALDYALVEAELTDGPRSDGVEPLELDRASNALSPDRPIYTITGHAGMTFLHPDKSIGGGHEVVHEVEREIAAAPPDHPAGFRTIALGRVKPDSNDAIWINTSNTSVLGVLAKMPNMPGMSGSPVFARDTHRVVSLHFSGGGAQLSWEESSVPMSRVIDDIRIALHNGVVPADAQQLVLDLTNPP